MEKTKALELTENEAGALHDALEDAIYLSDRRVHLITDLPATREKHIDDVTEREELKKKVEALFPELRGEEA